MHKSSYAISPERSSLESEMVPDLDLPIIDFIRHGKSNYKVENKFLEKMTTEKRPLGHKEFRDVVRNGQKSSELVDEGFAAIQESAEQLASQIDDKNEVIYLVSSPVSRAWETADLFSAALLKANPKIKILNFDKKLESWLLKGTFPTAISLQDKELAEESETKIYVTRVTEWNSDRSNLHDSLETNFNRFLRHAINYKQWLSQNIQSKIKGKRVRIICFTHNELPYRFIRDSFAVSRQTPDLENAQIFEVRPQEKVSKGKSARLKVKVYNKGHKPEREQDVTFTFKPSETQE